MAKTPTPTPAAAETVSTVTVGKFTFDVDVPVPAASRIASAKSDDAERLEAMPVGASYLEPVTVPDTVTDEAEREKTFKEKARSTTNRLSGLVRRFKKNHADYEFALRTVAGQGVRVYRIEKAAAPAAAAAAAPATPTGTEGSPAPASA